MLILALDTSTRTGSVAVLRDRELLGTVANRSDEPYSSTLFRDVDTLLAELALSVQEIELFAVAAGPGSFTGLRIGLTAIKAWAEVFGRPIAAVSGLAAIAWQALSTDGIGANTIVSPMLDARRGQIFGARYRVVAGTERRLQLLGYEVLADAGEFLDELQESDVSLTFVCPTPEIVRPAIEKSKWRGSRLDAVSPVLAPFIGQLGYEQAIRGEIVDSLHLDANYIRRSDAEVKSIKR